MRIFALDLGATTGYYSDYMHGVQKNTIAKASEGMRLINFKKFLIDFLNEFTPDIVAYETPSAGNYKGTRAISQYEAILLAELTERNIEYIGYSAGMIKKFAADSLEEAGQILETRRMDKKKMKKAYETLTGNKPIDDNHADAYFMYKLAKKQFENG